MIKFQILALLFLFSCSSIGQKKKVELTKDFSPGEVILANQLLNRIFETEMSLLACVPNIDEAALLLRTLTPRMELVQDDIEATLDNPEAIEKLVNSCQNSCTCHYLDDLFREHQVVLSKEMKKKFESDKKQKTLNSCLSYVQETFCHSEIYKTLNSEKEEFTFD